MRRVFILCWLWVLVTSCGSESFTEVESARTPLISGFESYASREEVMAKLSPKMEVKVVNDTSLAKTDSQPPYRLYTASLSPFDHLKHRGKLQLTFYNNRLEQCMFYPDKLDSYMRTLEQTGLRLGLGREAVRGNTVIWAGTDEDQNKYVGWADKRLRDQQRRWLARYD
ncbi:MAG: hypothetical protein ACREQO_20420 [Candidatus Binatia bacterium]